jgi:hypothetical protein
MTFVVLFLFFNFLDENIMVHLSYIILGMIDN